MTPNCPARPGRRPARSGRRKPWNRPSLAILSLAILSLAILPLAILSLAILSLAILSLAICGFLCVSRSAAAALDGR